MAGFFLDHHIPTGTRSLPIFFFLGTKIHCSDRWVSWLGSQALPADAEPRLSWRWTRFCLTHCQDPSLQLQPRVAGGGTGGGGYSSRVPPIWWLPLWHLCTCAPWLEQSDEVSGCGGTICTLVRAAERKPKLKATHKQGSVVTRNWKVSSCHNLA